MFINLDSQKTLKKIRFCIIPCFFIQGILELALRFTLVVLIFYGGDGESDGALFEAFIFIQLFVYIIAAVHCWCKLTIIAHVRTFEPVAPKAEPVKNDESNY